MGGTEMKIKWNKHRPTLFHPMTRDKAQQRHYVNTFFNVSSQKIASFFSRKAFIVFSEHNTVDNILKDNVQQLISCPFQSTIF